MEIRKSSENLASNGTTLSGYAVLFGVESRTINEHGRRFKEVIQRGAFDLRSLDPDVKLYFNHDTSMPLARQVNGSLRLFEDEKGIRFEADLPDTTLAKDIRELMRTGVLTGEMSFGFTTSKDKWDAKGTHRTVQEGRIYEISLVVDAAYPATHSHLRSVMSEINRLRIKMVRGRIN